MCSTSFILLLFFLICSVCSLSCFECTHSHSGVVHAHSLNPNDFIATCNKCAHMVNGVVYCVVLPMRNFHLLLKELNLIIFVGEGWGGRPSTLNPKTPNTMYSFWCRCIYTQKSRILCVVVCIESNERNI